MLSLDMEMMSSAIRPCSSKVSLEKRTNGMETETDLMGSANDDRFNGFGIFFHLAKDIFDLVMIILTTGNVFNESRDALQTVAYNLRVLPLFDVEP